MLIPLLMTCLSLGMTDAYLEEYIMDNDNETMQNWTSCEEFLNETTFDVDSVIDIDWVIFYYWSNHPETSYHIRFSVPSPMLVERFHVELDDDLLPRVNWSHAELFVETSVDLSGLFVRSDLPGKFRLIPSFSFQFHYAPLLQFGLKVVDGYLALMNCKQRVAYALAPVQKMPSPLELEEKASLFGIQNPLGRSYLTKSKYDTPAQPLQTTAPDDDVDDLEDMHGPALTRDMFF